MADNILGAQVIMCLNRYTAVKIDREHPQIDINCKSFTQF